MTLRQLHQLEQGGSSAFYSEAIQHDMGMKLLRRLNVPASALAALQPSAPLADPGLLESAERRASPTPPKPPMAGNGSARTSPKVPSASGLSARLAWTMVGVGLIGAGLLMVWWPGDTGADVAPLAPAESRETSQASLPLPSAEETNAMSSTPERTGSAEAPLQSAEAGCGLGESLLRLSPERPSRSADYVYLVAIDEVTVCVRDAQGQQTHLTLQAGRNANVAGHPPFDLTADALSHVQVFFQGQRMTLPPGIAGVRLQPQDTRH